MAMDSDTLLTASTYLNNLLLARGLLRNAKPVDFAKPTRETRVQIINLVHDLLLKRDRDEENREQVADTVRTLRSSNERKDAELQRLQTRLAEKERSHAQAQTATRNAKAELKPLQTSVRNLQAQLVKTKTLAEQIKTQCANDVRKRDMQIERLKAHLQGQQRGNRSLIVAPSISITGGSLRGQTPFKSSVRGLQDPGYSLKQESNEFLTQLSSSLSDENDGLIALVQSALQTLRGILGVDAPSIETDTGANSHDVEGEASQATTLEVMSRELGGILITMKGLLTNPNFVPMEEVDIRDEEILRLREGWEKMEARWGDVLLMMDGWRKRLEKTGDTINLDDLKFGLGLGAGIEEIRQAHSPARLPRRSVVLDPIDEGVSEIDVISRDSGVSMSEEAVTQHESPAKKAVEPPEFFDLRPSRSKASRSPLKRSHSPSATAANESKRSSRGQEPSFDHAQSSSFLEDDVPEVAPMSMQDKLMAAQAEAEAARIQPPTIINEAAETMQREMDDEVDDQVGVLKSPAKKTKIKGRPRRRKSTLSPEELESLLNLDQD